MADPPAQPKSSFGFLTRKIGPVPIWLIGLAGFGAYWWWTHRTPAAAPAPTVVSVTGPAGPRGPRGPAGTGPDRDRPPPRGESVGTVPNVVGQKYRSGAERLADAGFRAQRSSPFVGTIESESPHAGSRAEKGSLVTLRGKPWPPGRGRETESPMASTAVAPMTAGDIYGSTPTSTINGETYQSGQPSDAELAGAYVPAG